MKRKRKREREKERKRKRKRRKKKGGGDREEGAYIPPPSLQCLLLELTHRRSEFEFSFSSPKQGYAI